MRMARTAGLAVTLALIAPASAHADGSLRCDGHLVSAGATVVELLASCGPPALREDRVEQRTFAPPDGAGGVRELRETAVVERWTYNFGSGQLLQIVTVEAGLVRRVEAGARDLPLVAAQGELVAPSERFEAQTV